MNAIAIIPARYASTRLPGKPLLAETGKPLIQHVVEAVRVAQSISRIVVATDDARIATAVTGFGGETVMTREDCRSGTDRLAEAAAVLGLDAEQIVINVQGDEPDIDPSGIDLLTATLATGECPMATLACPLSYTEANDPGRVKVVCDNAGHALYFSRARIPFDRDANGDAGYLLHLGVYAYRAGFLKTYAQLPSTPAERIEKLEQLRVLEHGYRIAVASVRSHAGGIDTPADYSAFVRRMRL